MACAATAPIPRLPRGLHHLSPPPSFHSRQVSFNLNIITSRRCSALLSARYCLEPFWSFTVRVSPSLAPSHVRVAVVSRAPRAFAFGLHRPSFSFDSANPARLLNTARLFLPPTSSAQTERRQHHISPQPPPLPQQRWRSSESTRSWPTSDGMLPSCRPLLGPQAVTPLCEVGQGPERGGCLNTSRQPNLRLAAFRRRRDGLCTKMILLLTRIVDSDPPSSCSAGPVGEDLVCDTVAPISAVPPDSAAHGITRSASQSTSETG